MVKKYTLFIEGLKKSKEKVRFYHASGTKYKVGQIIGGPGERVFLNTSPVVHRTIWEAVLGGFSSWKEYQTIHMAAIHDYWDKRMEFNKGEMENKPEYPKTVNKKKIPIWVYEVKPFKAPLFHGVNDEYIAIDQFVEIVSIVGNARGILLNHIKKFGKNKASNFRAKSFKKK